MRAGRFDFLPAMAPIAELRGAFERPARPKN
jgi:hypothetical protein